jgi:hypothetical protein
LKNKFIVLKPYGGLFLVFGMHTLGFEVPDAKLEVEHQWVAAERIGWALEQFLLGLQVVGPSLHIWATVAWLDQGGNINPRHIISSSVGPRSFFVFNPWRNILKRLA